MLKKLTHKIVSTLWKGGFDAANEKEIYEFGIETAILKFVHIITMVLIGIAFGLLVQTILFVICYSTIRAYAGGFHAKTRINCYIISVIMIIAVLFVLKISPVQYRKQISLVGMLLSTAVILWLSPEDNPNKRLDQIEINRYKKIVIKLIIIEIAAFIVLWIINLPSYLLIISLSNISISVTLIASKLQKIEYKNIFFRKADR